MATAIKTPGVYIKELDAFPNTVVQVPTAVPAFFGYTEKLPTPNEPIRITSMKGFIDNFGIASADQGDQGVPQTQFAFTDVNTLTPVANTRFLLYYSMRLFFDNGGSTCWVVSTGTYADSMSKGKSADDFTSKLDELKKYQEPTMVVAPDAVLLSIDGWQKVCQQFLIHCNDMQSRVAILDVQDGDDERTSDETTDPIAVFRDRVGSDFLNYGQAYYPWVNTSIVDSTDLNYSCITDGTLGALMNALTSAVGDVPDKAKQDLTDLIGNMQAAKSAVGSISQALRDTVSAATIKDKTDQTRASISTLIDNIDNTTDATKLTAAITDLTTAATGLNVQKDIAKAVDELKGNKSQGLRDLRAAAAKIVAPSSKTAILAILDSMDKGDNAALDAADAATLKDLSTKLTAAASSLADPAKTDITAAAGNLTDATKKTQALSDLRTAAAKITDNASKTVIMGILADAALISQKASLTTAVAGITDSPASHDAIQAILVQMGKVDQEIATLTTQANNVTDADSKKAILAILGGMSEWGANLAALSVKLRSAAAQIPNAAQRTDFIGKMIPPAVPPPSVTSIHQSLIVVSPVYKQVITNIQKQLNLLPPSAGMAGVYTRIDNNIGVFKAPANTTINSVVSPALDMTDDDQMDLNVPLDGKAINAIRVFPGRGVLIWGARTLDGNSQDWRYINVRRTIIMLEQSIKYACLAYVFEPNTAPTWVTVKNMISNFLTNQWKSGALAGSKPEEAYSVDVGLGSTMTADDILDGHMNVTVKVALVHPAEFIVITFQQKMQTS